jgi:hypothetical protein
MMEGSGAGSILVIREAQKHTDPTDPDPQHWEKRWGKGKIKEKEERRGRS